MEGIDSCDINCVWTVALASLVFFSTRYILCRPVSISVFPPNVFTLFLIFMWDFIPDFCIYINECFYVINLVDDNQIISQYDNKSF